MAAVADFLVSKLCEALLQIAKDELARQMGLLNAAETLRKTLEMLKLYLQDAEDRSIGEASVNLWLNKIKDVMYDIDDVLAEYAMELLDYHKQRNVGGIDADKASSSSLKTVDHPAGRSSARKQVCPCLPLPSSCFQKVRSKHRISVQIQELNRKINDEIISQIPILKLITDITRISSSALDPMSARKTHYALVRSDIVGSRIHEDARRLIESLLAVQETDQNQLLVYAIVGIGGIGKTTLAKLVFDDNRIKSCFEEKVWVSVTQNYSQADILTSILASYGTGGHQNFNSLCEDVISRVQGKRLFMVLDDVWESNRIWSEWLRSLLLGSTARGSRVLVTTRDMAVAKQMMAFYSHQMRPLLPEDGWLLLCKSAFPFREQKEAINDKWNLKDVGMEFVEKCDCLPLAINVIGGILLVESKTRESWEIILKNSLWKVNGLPPEIHAALYMSYQYLPANIKQCFLYYSLFPVNTYIHKSIVWEYWIQEGFIKEETNLTAYEVGERYLRLLVQRNLLMPDPRDAADDYFKMHDLLRSLSHFLMQNDTLVLNDKEILRRDSSEGQMKLRRLSLIGGCGKIMTTTTSTTNSLPKSIEEQVKLRTFLASDKLIDKLDDDLFNRLRFLRVLSLRRTSVTELPVTIGILTHLKLLDISYTPIKKLPQTIENLKSLKALMVHYCESLTALPSCIMKLHQLCFLTTFYSALDCLPPGLLRLNKLQFLDFVVLPEDAAHESSTINELAGLVQLRHLVLSKLERISDKSQARCAALREKKCLKYLLLECSESDSSSIEVTNRAEEIFEELCPPPQLRTLGIFGYSGQKLPSWLGRAPSNHLLGQLVRLTIYSCSNCKQLDGLGLLSNLEALNIERAHSIKSIGPEFYSNSNKSNIAEKGVMKPSSYNETVFLPNLRYLNFNSMDSWEEWSCLGMTIPVMPHLEILQIVDCAKLKSLPEELLHHTAESLKRISIQRAYNLGLKVVQSLTSLEELTIEYAPYLERISRLPALQDLILTDCPRLMLVKLQHPLRMLQWTDFRAKSLPAWIFNSNDNAGDDCGLKASLLVIKCNMSLVHMIKDRASQRMIDSKSFENFNVFDKYKQLRVSYTETPYKFETYFDDDYDDDEAMELLTDDD